MLRWESAAITSLLRVLPLGFVTHDVSHLGYDRLEGVAVLFSSQAVAVLPLAVSGFTAIAVILGSGRVFLFVCLFFMLQELILGKVPFFPLPSLPWEMSASRNVPQSRWWLREGWALVALWVPQEPREGEAAHRAAFNSKHCVLCPPA